jgi:hypothetical protein
VNQQLLLKSCGTQWRLPRVPNEVNIQDFVTADDELIISQELVDTEII